MAHEPLADRLGRLTVLEALELSRRLEEKWQIEHRSHYPTIWDPVLSNDDPYRGLRYDVTLVEAGPNQVEAIKAVRRVINIGVAETKHLLEHLPRSLAEEVKHEEAARIERTLGEVGARVTVVQRSEK